MIGPIRGLLDIWPPRRGHTFGRLQSTTLEIVGHPHYVEWLALYWHHPTYTPPPYDWQRDDRRDFHGH